MRYLLVAFVVLFGISLSACNTVEGFGQDMSSAGRGISGTADKAKH